MVFKDDNFRLLGESDAMLAGHIFETAYVFNKITEQTFMLDDFYGDPVCALIDRNGHWCAVGGEKLVILYGENLIRPPLQWVHDMRQEDEHTFLVLIDPWSADAAIWRVTPNTQTWHKVRDFPDYAEKTYTDKVIW